MNTNETILIVDDNPTIRLVLSRYLKKEGYIIYEASGAQDMRAKTKKIQPDLILLDWVLPDGDGLTLTGELRRLNQEVGIMMLTGKADDTDKVVALEMGADDYLVKPVNLRELLARIRSVLRRRVSSSLFSEMATNALSKPKLAQFSGWHIDFIKRTLSRVPGEETILTSQEFRLLEELIIMAPHVISRARLLEVLLGRHYNAETRSIDVIIGKLRQKIEQQRQKPRIILTVRGMGYQLATEVQFIS